MQAILSLPPIDFARLPHHHYVCTLTAKSAQVGLFYQFKYQPFHLPESAQSLYHHLQSTRQPSQSAMTVYMAVQLVGGAGYKAFIDAAPLVSEPLPCLNLYMVCLDALQLELSRMLQTTPTDN